MEGADRTWEVLENERKCVPTLRSIQNPAPHGFGRAGLFSLLVSNITVELPLKAIVRGYSWAVIPITWRNRRHVVGKLAIREMGSRYLFICL
jgi:hypothetical protein